MVSDYHSGTRARVTQASQRLTSWPDLPEVPAVECSAGIPPILLTKVRLIGLFKEQDID